MCILLTVVVFVYVDLLINLMFDVLQVGLFVLPYRLLCMLLRCFGCVMF